LSFFGARVSGGDERGGEPNGEKFSVKNWVFIGDNKKGWSPG
jgi:hypothetical protein